MGGSDKCGDLVARIASGEARAGVVGLGYVGLPLAVEFAESGLVTTGIDVDAGKVEQINAGRSYVLDVPSERVAALVDAGCLAATTDFSVVAELDTINVCVPTPLRKTREPDLSFVVDALGRIAEHMHAGQLLILESTTYPGTTEELVVPTLREAGFEPGRDVEVAFSPERTDPGNVEFTTRNIPKVVGGMTERANEAASALYGRCIDRVVPVSSPRVAELVKLLENTFRNVNIALVNELAMMCGQLDIDVWEVIDAAATKPFGFMPFYPGPGLGGHCIPIDPQYLTWKARAEGFEARLIELASQINAQKPAYIVERIADALNEREIALKSSTVLALGVAYKRDVDDVRESPALDVMELLAEKGSDVRFTDPMVATVRVGERELAAVELSEDALKEADATILLTDHSAFDYGWIAETARLIIDTRNAFKGVAGSNIIRV
ncbi:MAG: nucleotide sugar dehydrogenase [Deltaproteobacteria bacterium]